MTRKFATIDRKLPPDQIAGWLVWAEPMLGPEAYRAHLYYGEKHNQGGEELAQRPAVAIYALTREELHEAAKDRAAFDHLCRLFPWPTLPGSP